MGTLWAHAGAVGCIVITLVPEGIGFFSTSDAHLCEMNTTRQWCISFTLPYVHMLTMCMYVRVFMFYSCCGSIVVGYVRLATNCHDPLSDT